MNTQNKSKEELIKELLEQNFLLHEENNSLKASYEKDISKHKLTEEALKESEEQYGSLFFMAEEGIFIMTTDGKFVEINGSFARMHGYTVDEMMKMKLKDLVTPETEKMNPERLRHILEGNNLTFEVEHYHKDGHIFQLEVSANLISHGGESFIQCFHRDITARKKAEEALRESEEKFRLIFENNSSAIAIIEPDTTISMVNKEYCKVSGYKKQEVIGMSWTQQIPPEDLERLKEFNRRRLLNPTDAPDKYEFKFRQKNGEIKHALMSVSMLSNRKIIASFIDITERKKAEEELRESEENLRKINAEKDKFFSIIAHDLRSPFNGFLGLTEIMAEGMQNLTLEEIQRIAVSLKYSAANLYSLLGNLLEWSLMQRGLTAFEPQLFLLSRKITESMALVTEAADKKEIAISYDIPEDLTVFVDRNMFEGVIRNLSSNAVKFTNKGGVVNVSAKTMPDNSVEISFKDTGIGMNKEMTDNLFRIDIDTSRKGTEDESSTGLGLFICKDFIEKHGGELRVDSEEGKGSTFTLTIPKNVQSNAGEHFEVVTGAEHSGEIKDLKILIAEDDEKSDRLLKLLLKTITKEVLHAKTGIEAVEVCRNNPDIDVVLMDIKMPEMDGYEATRQIRKFNKDVVIIMQTAHGLSGDREDAIEAGCNDYILKPIMKGEIITMIKKCIK